jgi:hypothetical protein
MYRNITVIFRNIKSYDCNIFFLTKFFCNKSLYHDMLKLFFCYNVGEQQSDTLSLDPLADSVL